MSKEVSSIPPAMGSPRRRQCFDFSTLSFNSPQTTVTQKPFIYSHICRRVVKCSCVVAVCLRSCPSTLTSGFFLNRLLIPHPPFSSYLAEVTRFRPQRVSLAMFLTPGWDRRTDNGTQLINKRANWKITRD